MGAPTLASRSAPGQVGLPSQPAATAYGSKGILHARPAPAGKYWFAQSGSIGFNGATKPVPSRGTLTIDRPTADGEQTWHQAVRSTDAPSDTTFLFRNGGIFTVQTVDRVTAQRTVLSFPCAFAPGVPSPPWPPKVGDTFVGHGECADFTADVSGRVTGVHDVVIGTTLRHTIVIAVSATSHGRIESTGTQLDWFDPSDSMIVHSEVTQKGTYGGVFPFSYAVTSDLLSGG